MTKNPAAPEEKPKAWRDPALYIPVVAIAIACGAGFIAVYANYHHSYFINNPIFEIFFYILLWYFPLCGSLAHMLCYLAEGKDKRDGWSIGKFALLRVTLFLGVLGIADSYGAKLLIGNMRPISLEAWLGGLLAIWGVALLARRTANQDKQLTIQINKEIDDRFIAAVTLLGSRESSARTGAVYSLYHLAIESEKYRKQIAQILCSHIRSKTQEKDYQAEHKERPSNEIQTAIDILFKDVNGVKGLYCQNFAQADEFPRANLFYAHLCGADFTKAQCQGADFSFSRCYNSRFDNAHCQKAEFLCAKCIGAFFVRAQLHGASFVLAECQKAFFTHAECHGASFWSARFHCAILDAAQFQGANLHMACFQSVTAREAINFCGAYIDIDAQLLENRIGRDTEVTTATFEGEWSPSCAQAIKEAEPYFPDYWPQEMQMKMDSGKRQKRSNQLPDYVIAGVLEDGEEIRKIAAEIKKWTR